MAEAFSKATKYKKDSDKWRVLTDSVTRYLVLGMVPFRTVEKSSFKEMLNTFDKQYELPGRNYFSQTAVPALYSKVKDDVQREIQEISNFALTTDMWSICEYDPIYEPDRSLPHKRLVTEIQVFGNKLHA